MRCTQIMGLTKRATKFLEDNARQVPLVCCPKCQHIISTKLDSVVYHDASNMGMFDDGPALQEYTLQNGKKVKEVVQDAPWSSGPCIFLCLEDEDGKRMYEWSRKAIENA